MKNKQTQFAIGIDIGGTWIKGVVLASQKRIMDKAIIPTPKSNSKELLSAVIKLVDDLLKKSGIKKISSIGLGLPGSVDQTTGRLMWAANSPHLQGVNPAMVLSRKYGVFVRARNDADCFVLAEAMLGAGKDKDSVYGIAIGTGIGGAWFINKAVHAGFFGGGGEPGHMVIDFKGCHTLNAYYRRLFRNDPGGLARRAKAGHLPSLAICREFGRVLGIAIANISNVIAPDVFVIGGGMRRHARLFLPASRESARRHMVPGPVRNKTRIVCSRFGDFSGAIGAALFSEF